jgi:uncharacterized protein involved in cysteine biosynthesis
MEAIIEFIVQVLFEGLIMEGVVGLLRVIGALVRWPFQKGRTYIQVLREDGNGWTGLLTIIVLILLVVLLN